MINRSSTKKKKKQAYVGQIIIVPTDIWWFSTMDKEQTFYTLSYKFVLLSQDL